MPVQTDQRPVSSQELGIVVADRGTTTVIELDGEWDLAARDATRAAIGHVLARRPDCVVLDLGRVSFIDASGVHVVVGLARRAEAEQVYLVIVPGPPAVQRVFALCRQIEELPFVAGGARARTQDGVASRLHNRGLGGSHSRHQRRRSPAPYPGGRRRLH